MVRLTQAESETETGRETTAGIASEAEIESEETAIITAAILLLPAVFVFSLVLTVCARRM